MSGRTRRIHCATATAVAVLAAAACAPPRLLLTEKLYQKPPDRRLDGTEVKAALSMHVHDARGALAGPSTDRRLAFDVEVRDVADVGLPPRVRAYTDASADPAMSRGLLALAPDGSRRRWPEGFVAAEITAVGLRVVDAAWFTDEGVRAEVAVTGSIAESALAEATRYEATATAAERGTTPWRITDLPEPLRRVVAALRLHPWHQLLGLGAAAGQVRCDPVAWCEGAAHLSAGTVAARMADDDPQAADGCDLVVRFTEPDGTVRYRRVPLPLLREGADLLLWREGDRVRFTRREVWNGSLGRRDPEAPTPPPLAVALATPDIRFTVIDLEQRSSLLYDLRHVLSVITVPIDIVVATNPALRALVQWIVGDDDRFIPPPQRGGDR